MGGEQELVSTPSSVTRIEVPLDEALEFIVEINEGRNKVVFQMEEYWALLGEKSVFLLDLSIEGEDDEDCDDWAVLYVASQITPGIYSLRFPVCPPQLQGKCVDSEGRAYFKRTLGYGDESRTYMIPQEITREEIEGMRNALQVEESWWLHTGEISSDDVMSALAPIIISVEMDEGDMMGSTAILDT